MIIPGDQRPARQGSQLCDPEEGSCLRALPGGRIAPMSGQCEGSMWGIRNTQVGQSHSINTNRPGADGIEKASHSPANTAGADPTVRMTNEYFQSHSNAYL